ncbi:MAG: D-aminoacyl-tRNA deacylase [Planctomycetia bacterium]|nr:D-aminoacyl-tRNA deacylase [Planctomycetia bacterium]
MRACIQRVTRAQVSLPEEDGRVCGAIGRGLLVLLGVGLCDTQEDVLWLARKVRGLRIFDDPAGKMNLNVQQVGGSVLVVSQFTLYADTVRGNRPGFTEAAPPESARHYYDLFVQELRHSGLSVATGVFQANMHVELTNEGPVTIWMDSRAR